MGSKRPIGGGPSAKLRKRMVQLEACEKSGESVKAYAKRHGLSVDVLYQAKKEARRQGWIPPHRSPNLARSAKPPKGGSTHFVKAVRRTEAPFARSAAWRLHFPGGEVLESSTPLSADVVVLLLESLGRRS